MPRGSAEEIRRCIDRGLARYGRGELQEAIAEWERALSIDGDNEEAATLIQFVVDKLNGHEPAPDARDERKTDKAIDTFPEEWSGGFDTSRTQNMHEVPTRIADQPGATTGDRTQRVRHPTLESPIPQLLAQITAPNWEAPPPEREEGAPIDPVWEESTRRFGSEPRTIDAHGNLPSTAEMPLIDETTDVRVRVTELIDTCRDQLWNGQLEASATAAEMALREAEQAHDVRVESITQSARTLFEKTFEAYIGPVTGIPVFALSPQALAHQELDHRAGFVLSHIDGVTTIEHLLDVASMPRFEALRIIAGLLRSHAIRLL